MIHNENIFGPYKNGIGQKYKIYTKYDEIVSKARKGDTYSIYAVSGDGGDHSVTILKIEVLIKAMCEDMTEPKVITEGEE